jgi:hypothetical protein
MIQQSTMIRNEDPNDCRAFSSPLQGQDASALGEKRLQRFLMLQAKSAMTTDVLAVPLWMTLDELERLFSMDSPLLKGVT